MVHTNMSLGQIFMALNHLSENIKEDIRYFPCILFTVVSKKSTVSHENLISPNVDDVHMVGTVLYLF